MSLHDSEVPSTVRLYQGELLITFFRLLTSAFPLGIPELSLVPSDYRLLKKGGIATLRLILCRLE